MLEHMAKHAKRPRDTNQLAKAIVDQATSEEPEAQESPKAAAGRKGGLKGGKARAESLSAARRRAIARSAANARWSKNSE